MISHHHVIDFLILEHGLFGENSDLESIEVFAQEEHRKRIQEQQDREEPDSDITPHKCCCEATSRYSFIVINHPFNDRIKSLKGVEKCAHTLTPCVVDQVAVAVHNALVKWVADTSSDTKSAVSSSESVEISFHLELMFHMVGFSMGGLVIRAALPSIIEQVEAMYLGNVQQITISHENCTAKVSPRYTIHWKTFVSLSSPHVGSRIAYPRTSKLYCALKFFDCCCCCGWLTPTALRDLLMMNQYLEDELLKPSYLEALKKFDERVFIAVVTDSTVWQYSCAFYLPPIERRLLDGWKPGDGKINPQRIPLAFLTAEETVDGVSVPQAPTGEAEVKRAVELDELEQRPSLSCRTSAQTSTQEKNGNSPCVVVEDRSFPPDNTKYAAQSSSAPWVLRSQKDLEVIQENKDFLAAMSIFPATNVDELKANGIIIEQGAPSLSGPASGPITRKPWITSETWPEKYLPRERSMALTFLEGVGPVELHVVDFVAPIEEYWDRRVRMKRMKDNLDKNELSEQIGIIRDASHGVSLFAGENFRTRKQQMEEKKKGMKDLQEVEKEMAKAKKKLDKKHHAGRTRKEPIYAEQPTAPQNGMNHKNAATGYVAIEEQETKPLFPIDFIPHYVAWRVTKHYPSEK